MTNEAAERLHEHLCVIYEEARPIKNMLELQQVARDELQEALATERKATVERIQAAVLAYWDAQHPGLEHQTEQWAADLWAERNDLEGIILDAGAAREGVQ